MLLLGATTFKKEALLLPLLVVQLLLPEKPTVFSPKQRFEAFGA
jgi:hypothetical protein